MYIYERHRKNTQENLQNVQKYLKAVKLDEKSLRRVATPFIDESREPAGYVEPDGEGPLFGETRAAVTKPKKKNKGKTAQTTNDHKQLNVAAASIIMQTMYAARMAKPELQRCVGALATSLTKWTNYEGRKLEIFREMGRKIQNRWRIRVEKLGLKFLC